MELIDELIELCGKTGGVVVTREQLLRLKAEFEKRPLPVE